MRNEIKKYSIVILANAFYILSFLIFPFQLFMRTRRLFENYQPLDIIIMGFLVLFSMILSFYYANKSIRIPALALIIMSLVAYLGGLLLPIMEFANQLLPQIEIFGVRMVQYSIIYSAIAALSVFLAIQWNIYLESTINDPIEKKNNYKKTILISISFFMAVIVYFILTILYENSNTYFIMLSICSIASALLTRLIIGKYYQVKGEKRKIIEEKSERKPLFSILLFIDWFFYSAVIIGALFLYSFFLADDREIIISNLISINMILGSILVVPYLILIQRKTISIILKELLNFISFLAVGILFYLGINDNFWITRYFILGFSIAPLTIFYLIQEVDPKRNTIRLFLFIITWLVAAYIAMVPAKINEVENVIALLKIGIPIIAIMKILVDVFLNEKILKNFAKQ